MSEAMTDEKLIERLRTEAVTSGYVRLEAASRLEAANKRIAELENAMKGKTMFCAGCEESAKRIADLEDALNEKKAEFVRMENAWRYNVAQLHEQLSKVKS